MSDGYSNLLVPVLALIVADLSLSDVQAGLLLSAFSLSSFLFVFPLSVMSDHSGHKLAMLVVGLTLASFAYASMLFVQSLASLLVLSLYFGMGIAAKPARFR